VLDLARDRFLFVGHLSGQCSCGRRLRRSPVNTSVVGIDGYLHACQEVRIWRRRSRLGHRFYCHRQTSVILLRGLVATFAHFEDFVLFCHPVCALRHIRAVKNRRNSNRKRRSTLPCADTGGMQSCLRPLQRRPSRLLMFDLQHQSSECEAVSAKRHGRHFTSRCGQPVFNIA
jgi:hypothetical protein